mgnify:CR=1 FL=1
MLHSLWILAATFFTVLTYVFVKWVPPQYEIWDIFFVRSCYMAFFAVLMAAVAKTPLKTKIPKAHIGRADMRHARFADQHRDRTASADRHG